MTNSFHAGLLAITATCLLLSCRDAANTPNTATTATTTASDSAQPTVQVIPRRERVLTAEEQKALTPDQVLDNLKAGNQRFVRNDVTARDHLSLIHI